MRKRLNSPGLEPMTWNLEGLRGYQLDHRGDRYMHSEGATCRGGALCLDERMVVGRVLLLASEAKKKRKKNFAYVQRACTCLLPHPNLPEASLCC